MSKNRIAAALRALTVAPSLESDVTDALTTGDGAVTTTVPVEEAQTTQADVEGEDKSVTGKVVKVDNGPEGVESAETTAEESEVITTGEVSQEGFKGAAIGAVAGFFLLPILGGTVLGAAAGHLVEEYLHARAEAAATQAAALKAIAAGDEKKVGQLRKKFEEQTTAITDLQDKIKAQAAKKKVSQESVDDNAVDAAAAFAAGAAGAAEAAAQATEEGTAAVEEVPVEAEATDAPAVVEEAAEEVAEAEVEAAAEVAESQAEAVEAEATQVEAVELPEEIAEQDEIDAGEAEMDELEADIVEGEQHVEKFEQAAATLESLVEAISQAQQTGGLTPQAAQFMNIGFESVGVFLTGKPFTNARGEAPIPSMESFGGSMRRDQATSISMESAREWLEKVLEVLKKTFISIKNWMVEFFQAVFSQTERYMKRAAKIKAAANKLRAGAQPKNAQFQLAQSVANKIHINGEVSYRDLRDLAELTKVAAARNEEGTRALIQVRQNLKDIAAKAATLKGGAKEIEDAIVSNASRVIHSGDLRNAAFSILYGDGDLIGYKTKVLPGGVEMGIIYPATENSLFRVIVSSLRGWRVVTIKDDTVAKTEVKTLSGGEITQIAGDVEDILATIKKAKADFKAEALDIGNFTVDVDVPENVARKINKLTVALGKSVQTQTSGTSKLFKYVVSTTGAYLDFAAASLKQYGEAT